jgi:hypothetical protein
MTGIKLFIHDDVADELITKEYFIWNKCLCQCEVTDKGEAVIGEFLQNLANLGD